MSKIKYFSLCASMLFCMVFFTGCWGEDPAAEQETRQTEEYPAAGGARRSAFLQRWNERLCGIDSSGEQELEAF